MFILGKRIDNESNLSFLGDEVFEKEDCFLLVKVIYKI